MQIARDYGCLFIDFNLCKESQELFPDTSAFTDQFHLSSDMAPTFTLLLADTIKRYDAGADIFADYYSSYEEVLEQYEPT